MLTMTLMKAEIPNLRVYRLLWSGRNRQSDRDEAAQCLAAKLDTDPTVPTILIGHSHGGSVAHSALMRSNASGNIRGVVCFNTPFFTVLRRNLMGRLPAAFWFWTFGGIGAMPLVAHDHVSPVLFTVAAAVWIAGVLLQLWVYTKPEALLKMQQMLAPTRKPCKSPFFCMTTDDDEAFGSLSTIEGICNLPLVLLSPWLLLLYMLLGIALTMSGVRLVHPQEGGDWWRILGSYAGSVYLWAACFYFVSFVLALPAGLIALGLSQGLWNPFATYLVRSVVTLAPHFAEHVEFREFQVGIRDELSHSVLYKDETVCAVVGRWVKARLDHRGQPLEG
jgi:hypothetical protein